MVFASGIRDDQHASNLMSNHSKPQNVGSSFTGTVLDADVWLTHWPVEESVCGCVRASVALHTAFMFALRHKSKSIGPQNTRLSCHGTTKTLAHRMYTQLHLSTVVPRDKRKEKE